MPTYRSDGGFDQWYHLSERTLAIAQLVPPSEAIESAILIHQAEFFIPWRWLDNVCNLVCDNDSPAGGWVYSLLDRHSRAHGHICLYLECQRCFLEVTEGREKEE